MRMIGPKGFRILRVEEEDVEPVRRLMYLATGLGVMLIWHF